MCRALFILLLSTITLCTTNAQVRVNLLSKAQYEAITFKGKTIAQINNSKGSSRDMDALFGTPATTKLNEESISKTYIYDGNEILFRYDSGFTNGQVTILEITDSHWPVVINGKTIKVGDTETSLKQKFGSTLKIFDSVYRQGRFLAFNYSENDYDSIHIDINPATNTVTKIEYYILP